MSAPSESVLVVPCYNEEQRLDRQAFIEFARAGHTGLLLANDGSSDATAQVLEQIRSAAPERVRVLGFEQNRGKAETVRRGLLSALEAGASIVGYADADLSTPFDELLRLLQNLQSSAEIDVVLGSRIALLGTQIERTRARHYLGRVFATVASLLLELRVYDTQCGAKFFRVTPALRAALDEPFHSSWAFDVELLGRLVIGAPGVPPVRVDAIRELPLRRWQDVGGSRLKPLDMARAMLELGIIRSALTERRRSVAVDR